MGPIPARTGQPQRSRRSPGSSRAYPRSHGATRARCRASTEFWGLSPLARGNRLHLHHGHLGRGPIPARTGQPVVSATTEVINRAYPRSHGATPTRPAKSFLKRGLSPLARGNQLFTSRGVNVKGPIPARTGQPPSSCKPSGMAVAYPRSHGATISASVKLPCISGLSPLARGNLAESARILMSVGPIPARTGQPNRKG